MILIDYSQVALSTILTFKRELHGDEAEVKNLIRHATLSTIKSYKKKYGKEYGDIVLCTDGRAYWRKEVFPHYKASRKKSRASSDLNWKLIFDTLTEMRHDIEKYFPYKVINVNRAEGDDVIAVITRYLQDNELVTTGLIEEAQPILILSSDKDFKQLQLPPYSTNNVRQWSPMQKKYIKASRDEIKEFAIEHIVKGDSGDGVPNILSPDNVFVTAERQSSVSRKRLDEFKEKGFAACRTDDERRNWHRNERLVAFEHIPQDVQDEIISSYINSEPNKDKMLIMTYLMENRCRLLLDDIEDF